MNDDNIAMQVKKRLIRWNIIAEHQLSFIEECGIYKSSSNILKLGKTIEILNLNYSDYIDWELLGQYGEKNEIINIFYFNNVQGNRKIIDYDITLLKNDLTILSKIIISTKL